MINIYSLSKKENIKKSILFIFIKIYSFLTLIQKSHNMEHLVLLLECHIDLGLDHYLSNLLIYFTLNMRISNFHEILNYMLLVLDIENSPFLILNLSQFLHCMVFYPNLHFQDHKHQDLVLFQYSSCF